MEQVLTPIDWKLDPKISIYNFVKRILAASWKISKAIARSVFALMFTSPPGYERIEEMRAKAMVLRGPL